MLRLLVVMSKNDASKTHDALRYFALKSLITLNIHRNGASNTMHTCANLENSGEENVIPNEENVIPNEKNVAPKDFQQKFRITFFLLGLPYFCVLFLLFRL